MPLELHPVTPDDMLSWLRIRSIAYYGPTHDVLHNGAITDSSIRGVAESRKQELKQPNMWHWIVIDTDLRPGEDDPPSNPGQTIAISAWTLKNAKKEVNAVPALDDAATSPTQKQESEPPFLPPELRLDALNSLFGPLHDVQEEVMGSEEPYLMLRTLATHPDHQRRGAAKILLDWGLKMADDLGVPTYLDGTSIGKPVYDKNGFKVIKTVEWDREPWGGKGKDCHWCMVRQPRKSQ